MENNNLEIPIGEFIACIVLLVFLGFVIGYFGSILYGWEFNEVPFIHRFFRGRGTLYKTGYNDGLEHKMISEYDLKRDRKIQRLENKMYRAQKRYDEFYLNIQKEKLRRDEK